MIYYIIYHNLYPNPLTIWNIFPNIRSNKSWIKICFGDTIEKADVFRTYTWISIVSHTYVSHRTMVCLLYGEVAHNWLPIERRQWRVIQNRITVIKWIECSTRWHWWYRHPNVAKYHFLIDMRSHNIQWFGTLKTERSSIRLLVCIWGKKIQGMKNSCMFWEFSGDSRLQYYRRFLLHLSKQSNE